MKKTKLISSLCLLALTICSLAFGVYSAVTASFSASGSITFNALNCDCTFDITIKGVEDGTIGENNIKSRTLKVSTFTKSGYTKITDEAGLGTLKFDELNTLQTDAVWEEWHNKMEITITMTNYSKFSVSMQIDTTVATTSSSALTRTSSATKANASQSDGTTGQQADPVTVTVTATNKINAVKNNLFGVNISPEKSWTDFTADDFSTDGVVLRENGTISMITNTGCVNADGLYLPTLLNWSAGLELLATHIYSSTSPENSKRTRSFIAFGVFEQYRGTVDDPKLIYGGNSTDITFNSLHLIQVGLQGSADVYIGCLGDKVVKKIALSWEESD